MAVRVTGSWCWGVGLLVACGGPSKPPVQSVEARPPARAQGAGRQPTATRDPVSDAGAQGETVAPKTPPAQGAHSARTVGIRGHHGKHDGVRGRRCHERPHSRAARVCQQRPRSLGHVAGDIAFHFDVDGQGKVERVLVTQSDLGYATCARIASPRWWPRQPFPRLLVPNLPKPSGA